MEFISGESRERIIMLPDCIDDYITDDNSVQVIEAYINSLDLAALGCNRKQPNTTGRPINGQGGKVNVLGYFKGLEPGGIGEKTLYYEYEGEYKPLRFCVLRKTKEAEENGLKSLKKTRMRKQGNKKLSKAQRAYNQ